MDTNWLDGALKAHPGVTKDYKAEWGWERYMVGGKMFAATCCPGPEHALPYAGHPLLNLKCDPLESELLRAQYPDILPGFYSDKRNWISIRLDGGVPQPDVRLREHIRAIKEIRGKASNRFLRTAVPAAR